VLATRPKIHRPANTEPGAAGEIEAGEGGVKHLEDMAKYPAPALDAQSGRAQS
jgi:hypothetical protein